ncbi:MAG: type III polyketide synthase [FCB group bacterium]|jgi:prepilin-type processing-associated H-X9-DG protein|nr:type III polyketide synthase [FCB group bacterium]
MHFTILGQGTALPEECATMEESVRYAQDYFCRDDEERRKLAVLYRMTGVKRRYSVLLDGPEGSEGRHVVFPKPADEQDLGPGIGYRMDLYERHSVRLAVAAAKEALEDAGVRRDAITHLITVSCSGFAAPGVDIAIIKQLGLASTVQRTHVGFMGCHGALNGLRVARGFAESDPNACVLLCAVEVCSLHYHYGWHPERVVANALFADGAAAVVGKASNGEAGGAWRIADTGSVLVPDSEDAMTWKVGDHGFAMTLSARVPELIASHLKGWIEGWLGRNGLGIGDVQSWAVHPGGPRILQSVAAALALPEGALDISKDTLKNYGNMSSPTVLFILRRMRQEDAPRPCVALGFGPGLMAEATLFM